MGRVAQMRAMRDAWGELLAHGQSVKAVRISPVGDVFLLTDTAPDDQPSANANEAERFWDRLNAG